MEYIQSAWKAGSSFNNGLTAEEFFYNQIYDAVKVNVHEKTLPFFNTKANSVPVELSTGKIINDENLIALDQVASKNKYSSNLWIYGDVLEKLQHEGIRINFKKGTEPVLCLTKYANANHLNKEELYIAEGGNKAKAQFLYNYDSLDDRSKHDIDKYFKTAREIDKSYTTENFKNYKENVLNSRHSTLPELQRIKDALLSISKDASSLMKRGMQVLETVNIDLSPMMNAHARHMCQVVTGANVKNIINPATVNICYDFLTNIIEKTENNNGKKWIVGQALTKALDAGTKYAKSYTSKDFNLEVRKVREENCLRQEKLTSKKNMGWEY